MKVVCGCVHFLTWRDEIIQYSSCIRRFCSVKRLWLECWGSALLPPRRPAILWSEGSFIVEIMEDVASEYASSLHDLTTNSKPLISMLTMLAEEYRLHAPSIVKVIEDYLKRVSTQTLLHINDSSRQRRMKNFPLQMNENIQSDFHWIYLYTIQVSIFSSGEWIVTSMNWLIPCWTNIKMCSVYHMLMKYLTYVSLYENVRQFKRLRLQIVYLHWIIHPLIIITQGINIMPYDAILQYLWLI